MNAHIQIEHIQSVVEEKLNETLIGLEVLPMDSFAYWYEHGKYDAYHNIWYTLKDEKPSYGN